MSGRASRAYWIRAALVVTAQAGRAPAEPSAVADSAVDLVAAELVGCAVVAPVRYEAAAGWPRTDSAEEHSAVSAVARVDLVAEHCLADRWDVRSVLVVQMNDSLPDSLPAGCSEQADSSQGDCWVEQAPAALAADDYLEQASADHCGLAARPSGCRADCSFAHFRAAVVPGVRVRSKRASRQDGCQVGLRPA